jgi:hypothetical protein
MTQCHIALNPFKHEMIVHIQIEFDPTWFTHIQQARLSYWDWLFDTFVPMETYIKIYFFP